LSVALSTGCGKKTVVDSKVVQDAQKLPGASDVTAALNKKDYDGLVVAAMKVKLAITNEEQQGQFAVLIWEAKTKLDAAATTDPKAAEALMALRAMTTGVR
jgi:hypothetical protein